MTNMVITRGGVAKLECRVNGGQLYVVAKYREVVLKRVSFKFNAASFYCWLGRELGVSRSGVPQEIRTETAYLQGDYATASLEQGTNDQSSG